MLKMTRISVKFIQLSFVECKTIQKSKPDKNIPLADLGDDFLSTYYIRKFGTHYNTVKNTKERTNE